MFAAVRQRGRLPFLLSQLWLLGSDESSAELPLNLKSVDTILAYRAAWSDVLCL